MAGSTATHASAAAKRYAIALFELAQNSGALSDIHREFEAFAELTRSSDDLRRMLASPLIERADKVSALSKIGEKAGYSSLFAKFLGTMASNGRAGDIVGAQSAFDELFAKQRGVKRAVVRTAKEISAAELTRLEGIIGKAVGGDVELSTEVDESLIGGIQLQLGSRLIDASLKTKLDRMNSAMKGA